MKPSELSKTIGELIDIAPPMFVQGPPGVGKSDIIRAAAAEKGYEVVDVRAVLLDPVDLRGLPKVNGDGKAHWCPPAFLPSDPDWQGVIFLDELPQAAPLVQSACLQLTLDRRLGEYVLPPGARIIAAGNRVEDRAGAHRIITPLLNRFMHLTIDVSVEDWQLWAVENQIDERIRSFINFKPDMLMKFDPKSQNCAFATPRSWAFASQCLRGGPVHMEIVKGCVGNAAAEFCSFAELYHELPDPRQLLKDPANAEIPKDMSVQYALVGSLVEAFRADTDLMEPFATYVSRLAEVSLECSVLAFRDASTIPVGDTRRHAVTLKTEAGRAWLDKHGEQLGLTATAA